MRGDVQKSANADWIGFGHEIIAVADGVIYESRDGVTDNQPLVEPPRPTSPAAQETYGNYVIVAITSRTFVHYAHLQHNSVAVRTGQSVRRGDTIGRLGNSGNTNGPHLLSTSPIDPRPKKPRGCHLSSTGSSGPDNSGRGDRWRTATTNASHFAGEAQNEILLDGTVVRFR